MMATLYSFRRCPYAIRSRLALAAVDCTVELVEVDLKAKPDRMLELSPKGTVPVLHLEDGTVLEESLDIMIWALTTCDPMGWLGDSAAELDGMMAAIEVNDRDFKHHLDRTKYAVRYEGSNAEEHRTLALELLATLSQRLTHSPYLWGQRPKIADWALLPFVRQFANIDRGRFDQEVDSTLVGWLDRGLSSSLFVEVMKKGGRWAG